MLSIIGSVALSQHITQSFREANDLDIVGTYEEVECFISAIKANEKIIAQYPVNSGKTIYVKTDKRIIEASVAWPDSVAEKLYNVLQKEVSMTINMAGMWVKIPTLNMLYLLKMSHRYLKNSPHFEKTRQDIILMKSRGASIPEHLQEFFAQREKDTYNYGLPKLNKSKAEFFSGDGIEYEFDHDSLHEAVKFMDQPAYTFYSGGAVWSDMKKFETCDEEIKLNGVLEEALVLAAERSQLAFVPRPDPRWSFMFALQKVCTSITSGIFREYAYNNFDKVVALFDEKGYNYMQKVDAGIKADVVKRMG